MDNVTSASGTNLGPVGQCDLAFRLGNKQFTERFIILQDLCRNIILRLNWQCNYRIGCNWNVNEQEYITHNSKFLCTSTASSNTEPIVQNAGAFTLPPRSISVISIQAATELKTKHLYQLDTVDDLPLGIIPLAMNHKIDKYPKLMKVPLLNTEQDTVHIPRKTVIGSLQPIEVEDFEVSNISWTTYGTADTTNILTELPSLPPESSIQSQCNITKHSVVLHDAQILQEAKGELPSLLEGDYNSIISKSSMDVGRTNLFQMDIPNLGLPIAHKLYPNLLKYQKFIDEQIKLLENAGCISISLSPWAIQVIIVPK